jgi:hypothetical protein
MVAFNSKIISERIKEVVIREHELPENVAYDVAFHMTDWLEDLERYLDFCEKPNETTDEEINHLLLKFLIHVPNHIAAAAKLLTGIPVIDVFDVGAISEDHC